jgi:putative membrane protein
MDSTTRRLLLAVGLFVVVALSLSALMGGMMGPGFAGSEQAGQGPFGPGMMRGHGWMWGLGMGFGGLVMVAFWGVVIVGVILLIRSVGGAQGGLWHETPLNLLKRRYATGQITREQYEQMRKDLE